MVLAVVLMVACVVVAREPVGEGIAEQSDLMRVDEVVVGVVEEGAGDGLSQGVVAL
ncbi:MAG: hypothetical protein O7C59_01230 [Rickettsia endosymbiont of Ixodes persulcatus]|nr:hypothetical protein [Rickettsia endosymbiont of Ixodes persulcatus]